MGTRFLETWEGRGHDLGMFNKCSQDYPRQMNQHALSTEPGGYILAFSISRKWIRIVGSCAVAAGAVIAVLVNATEPFRAPLGIVLGVLAITLLIAVALKSPSRGPKPQAAQTQARVRGFRIKPGRRSVAAELALLAELHAKDALSDEEFRAAKLRTLGE
jgi:hypothetical protein